MDSALPLRVTNDVHISPGKKVHVSVLSDLLLD